MKNYIFNNFALKIMALLLAVISWFYIMGEIEGTGYSQKSVFEFSFPERYADKMVPIKINITGLPAAGYHSSLEKVYLNPKYCLVVGPHSLVKHLDYVLTEAIDISGADKTVTKQVALQKIANLRLTSNKKFVEVTIPIESEP